VDEVLQAIEAGSAYRTRSLTSESSDRNGDGERFTDHAAVDRADLTDDRLALRALLERSSLSDQAKRIVSLRFFGDMTQAEIGKIVGLSQVHVSRLLQRSVAHLREVDARTEITV
jgi:RNA polymerase sigma-B factor